MPPAQMSILICPRLKEWEWEDDSTRLYRTVVAMQQHFLAFMCVRASTVRFYHTTSKVLRGRIIILFHYTLLID